MIKLLIELLRLLSGKQRRKLAILQMLVVFMAFAEIAGIASIAPFMALVGDPMLLERSNLLSTIYQMSGIGSANWFVFWVGVGVLCTLSLSAFISMITQWRLIFFANQVGKEIADRLYGHYMHQSWLFHVQNNSAQLTKQISIEAVRVTHLILIPLMQMNSRLVLTACISIGLIIFDPLIAAIGLCLFGISYLAFYKLVRKKLHHHGLEISRINTERFRLMNEGFGGIKDVLLLGRQKNFIDEFQLTGKMLARSESINSILSIVPRYFIELVAFGSVILLILFLIKFNQGSLSYVLPILSVYALAGFKLLPSLQQTYTSLSVIKGSMSAFMSIKADLIAFKENEKNIETPNRNIIKLTDAIELKNLHFRYPNKDSFALQGLNIKIKINQSIGFVGASGSGKSTAVDILIGLIEPDRGKFLVNGVEINKSNKRAWQNGIGFVPQAIFLTEGSIAENVAFGLPKDKINLKQVENALSLAHLNEFVDSLTDGINTKVGERGVQLSGGQRQRIGIARALYKDADVLIFDEATSALDGITEKAVMDAIHDFCGKKTIILIAHRISTISKCDMIYLIDNGEVIDSGTYDELINKNTQFAKMAM